MYICIYICTYSEGVFDTLFRRARGGLETFRLDEMCGLLWAFAKALRDDGTFHLDPVWQNISTADF